MHAPAVTAALGRRTAVRWNPPKPHPVGAGRLSAVSAVSLLTGSVASVTSCITGRRRTDILAGWLGGRGQGAGLRRAAAREGLLLRWLLREGARLLAKRPVCLWEGGAAGADSLGSGRAAAAGRARVRAR